MAEKSEQDSGNGASAQDAAAAAEGRARDIGGAARQKAEAYADQAQQRIEKKLDEVASSIEGVASQLRSRADSVGPVGHAAGEQVARQMDAAAGYLHTHQSTEIAGDAVTYVKQHPIRSAILAFVLGYFVGRLLR